MVSAPALAKERGITVSEVRRASSGAFDSYIRLSVKTERQQRSVAGTVFSDGKPRVIQVKGINMEAELAPRVLYVTNLDQPGLSGRWGRFWESTALTLRRSIWGAKNRGAMRFHSSALIMRLPTPCWKKLWPSNRSCRSNNCNFDGSYCRRKVGRAFMKGA